MSSSIRSRRSSFSLRTLFLATALVAACAAFSRGEGVAGTIALILILGVIESPIQYPGGPPESKP